MPGDLCDLPLGRLDDPPSGDAYVMTGGTLSIAANRLSYFFDLHGPSMAIDTACSSSLVALHQACQSIWRGETTMALTGGVNVSPQEVEAVLEGAPGVLEAAVFGVPDSTWGEVVVGAVVLTDDPPTPTEVIDAHCRAHLTRAKCPTHIVPVPELPRTPSGKVARSRLPGLYEGFGDPP